MNLICVRQAGNTLLINNIDKIGSWGYGFVLLIFSIQKIRFLFHHKQEV